MNIERGLYEPILKQMVQNGSEEEYRKLLQMPEKMKQKNSSVLLTGSILECSQMTGKLLSSHAISESLITAEWLKESGYQIAEKENALKQAYLQHVPNVNYMVFAFQDWVRNYALFQAFKKIQQHAPWYEWPEELKDQPELQSVDLKSYQDDLLYFAFVQQMLFLEWKKIKQTANDLEIRIVGSLPYLPCYDSVDVWSQRECFTDSGDYDWQAMRNDHFRWWMDRIGYTTRLYDGVILESFGELAEHGGRQFFEELKNTSDELCLYVNEEEVLSDSALALMEQYGISRIHREELNIS